MRIIKNPEPIKCEKCGCVFEYNEQDIKDDYFLDYGAFLGILPLSKRCKGVRCPICDNLYVVNFL